MVVIFMVFTVVFVIMVVFVFVMIIIMVIVILMLIMAVFVAVMVIVVVLLLSIRFSFGSLQALLDFLQRLGFLCSTASLGQPTSFLGSGTQMFRDTAQGAGSLCSAAGFGHPTSFLVFGVPSLLLSSSFACSVPQVAGRLACFWRVHELQPLLPGRQLLPCPVHHLHHLVSTRLDVEFAKQSSRVALPHHTPIVFVIFEQVHVKIGEPLSDIEFGAEAPRQDVRIGRVGVAVELHAVHQVLLADPVQTIKRLEQAAVREAPRAITVHLHIDLFAAQD
mmetsp:Transcript_38052/g.74824  ORF Transcript_38052/g.74824 Transcript_38052/m.74824 type:complete len:277 (+) Transcript_38052:150-980(+)